MERPPFGRIGIERASRPLEPMPDASGSGIGKPPSRTAVGTVENPEEIHRLSRLLRQLVTEGFRRVRQGLGGFR